MLAASSLTEPSSTWPRRSRTTTPASRSGSPWGRARRWPNRSPRARPPTCWPPPTSDDAARGRRRGGRPTPDGFADQRAGARHPGRQPRAASAPSRTSTRHRLTSPASRPHPAARWPPRCSSATAISNPPALLEADVKAVLASGRSGEADAGLVYATDAAAQPRPAAVDPGPGVGGRTATAYLVAVTEQSDDPRAGRRLGRARLTGEPASRCSGTPASGRPSAREPRPGPCRRSVARRRCSSYPPRSRSLLLLVPLAGLVAGRRGGGCPSCWPSPRSVRRSCCRSASPPPPRRSCVAARAAAGLGAGASRRARARRSCGRW